jgi:ankyrin repeat protein
MVRLLLERGADADRADAVGLTPLHIAVLERHPQCAGLLMEAGASAEVADRFGRTPMELAKRCGHRACQAMVSGGADRSSNAKGERP